jgi:alcohol dehydrogenase class IV
MRFEFATASRIIFGAGEARSAAQAVAAFGSRLLLVTGTSGDRAGLPIPHAESFAVSGEPTVDMVRLAIAAARAAHCDAVVAVGGGSVIDAGKAIAALLANPGDPLDYLEVIGGGRALDRPSAAFIAIPTTAGTGSEVTRNAVLGSSEHGVKASLRSPHMLPALAIVDPELTFDLPRALTGSTGLDALTQLIEPFVSPRANPMTDLYCVEGIRRAAASLETACDKPQDRAAREAMSWASLLGGLSLANAGLGAVHAFAAPIGGMFPAPHGAVCAAILPHAIETNFEALRSRDPRSRALERYAEVARLVTRQPHAVVGDLVLWIMDLCQRLAIPPLSRYGVTEQDIPEIAAKAAKTSSMKGNPISLTEAELHNIARSAL